MVHKMRHLFDILSLIYIVSGTSLIAYLWLRRFSLLTRQPQIDFALSGGVGLGILSYTTAFLAVLDLLWMPAWLLIALLLLISALANRTALSLPQPRLQLPEWNRWSWIVLGLIGVHLILNLLAALAPATGVDSLQYHLAVPDIYLRNGGMVYLPSIYMSNWPSTVQMIFLYAMWLQGDTVAQLLNVWALVLTVVALYGLIRSYGSLPALLAGALYVSISDVTYQASVALIDVTATLFLLLSVVVVIHWLERRQGVFLILAGVLAGWYAGSRISNAGSVLALGLALGFLILYQEKRWKAGILPFLIMGTCAFITVFPWYVRSWFYTGNPTYPYLYSLFGGRDLSAEASFDLLTNVWHNTRLPPNSIIGFLKLPWDLTIDYRSGTLGPVVLALFPLLFVYRRHLPTWTGMGLLFGVISTLIWYYTYPRLRTLLPLLILLIALVVVCIHLMLRDSQSSLMVRLSVIACVVLWLFVGLGNNVRIHRNAVMATINLKDPDLFADEQLRSAGFDWYLDYLHLNRVLSEGTHLLIWDDRGYYLEHEYSRVSGLMRGMASAKQLREPEELLQLLYQLGITHVVWHPRRDFGPNKVKLRETLVSSGQLVSVYKTDTILVNRIDYDRTRTP
ncbi:glycosyltransferase family 39 protein [Acidobacteria bacterium AH-259-A15]|nr:glycosyltransferase family 39 protein [Acidobacteria bacterium AH-259-A15]